jgi:deoxyribonuclease V
MAGLSLRTDLSHPWDVSPPEARAIQERLRTHVVRRATRRALRFVAGTDVGFPDGGRITRAAAVLLAYPSLELVDQAVVHLPTRFPYVPGLLSFREVPALLDALAQLRHAPDCILCDGQGLAHPRRFGLACHLGVLTDLPTIGVGKSRLCGDFIEPGPRRGDASPLRDQGERIGMVLRTREGVRPVFVSIGHRMSLPQAVRVTLTCTPRYRLPETTRLADRIASRR